MKKLLKIILALIVLLMIIGAIVGNDEQKQEVAQQPTEATEIKTDSTPAKPSFEGRISKDVKYTVSEKGILIFDKAKDMFREFNDYRESEGEVKFLSEKPLSILITKKLDEDEKNLVKEYGEMSFLYAIYRTFMNTPENQVTVEAYPVLVTAQNKEIPQKAVKLKATVTREKALEILRKYTAAESIDDLVQTEENKEYRQVGMSGSKLWDKFVYNEKERTNIVKDLLK